MEDTTKIRSYYDVKFNGRAREFFQIWIVNVFLSIITLGIYSAWAKVRTNQYFYGNTYLDESAFEYTANPVNILKGRIMAVVLIALYQFCSYQYPQFSGMALLAIVLFVPAIVVKAIRFRMRYSRWRGIHFNFIPDYKAAYLLFLPVIFYFAVTAIAPIYFGVDPQQLQAEEGFEFTGELKMYFAVLGFSILGAMALFPWWQKAYYSFVSNRTQFGNQTFSFYAHGSEFYGVYFGAFAIAIGSGILVAMAVGLLNVIVPAVAAPLFILAFFFPYAISAAYVQTAKTNIIYSNLAVGDIHFTSDLKLKKMMYLYITNTIAILLTLGLAIPWAKIRMAAYRAQTLTLYSYGFDHFNAMLQEQENAQAEELSDLIGWDIGL